MSDSDREWVETCQAEITRLESELCIEQEFKAQAIEARNEAQAQLREYTEAEVVWQARRIVYGHAFGWSGIHRSEVDDYTTRRNCEVRRLVVAPKEKEDD